MKDTSIKLNDLLNLTDEETARTKCRFMVPSGRIKFDPLKNVSTREEREQINLQTLPWQATDKMYFRTGGIIIGFIRIQKDEWLFTGAVEVLDERKKGEPATVKHLERYSGFEFRVLVSFHNSSQNCVRHADKLLPELNVLEIWRSDERISEQTFSGYENVNLSWKDLSNALSRDDWRTALKNQKGVYLITDTKTNKRYVGSAYGDEMLLGRWKSYVENGHGGNKELEKLVEREGIDYVKNNFRYTILEIYRSTVNDDDIINRESFWKEILLTRNPDFGYNAN